MPYRVGDVDLGRPARETVCLRCHLGAERQKVVFQGAEFDHRPLTVARLPKQRPCIFRSSSHVYPRSEK